MTSPASELAGAVTVVTGGSRGLGREIVRGFAAAGSHVVIASRKLDNCVALADEVRAEHGVRAFPVAVNVSRWADCDALVEQVYAEFGRIDVLVNNAGLAPRYPALDEVSEDMFDKVVAVNLKGPFRLAATVGTRMVRSGGGTIINISSIEAVRPHPDALPYAAAKSGLNALTEGFAAAFAPSVRVNAIQAGPFLTDISTSWPEGTRTALEEGSVLGRCGRPDEVLGAALFLATSASSYTTGSVLRADGGLR